MTAKDKTLEELKKERDDLDARIDAAKKAEEKKMKGKCRDFFKEIKRFLEAADDSEVIQFIFAANKLDFDLQASGSVQPVKVSSKLSAEDHNAMIDMFAKDASNAEIAEAIFGVESIKSGTPIYTKIANYKTRYKKGKLKKK